MDGDVHVGVLPRCGGGVCTALRRAWGYAGGEGVGSGFEGAVHCVGLVNPLCLPREVCRGCLVL